VSNSQGASPERSRAGPASIASDPDPGLLTTENRLTTRGCIDRPGGLLFDRVVRAGRHQGYRLEARRDSCSSNAATRQAPRAYCRESTGCRRRQGLPSTPAKCALNWQLTASSRVRVQDNVAQAGAASTGSSSGLRNPAGARKNRVGRRDRRNARLRGIHLALPVWKG